MNHQSLKIKNPEAHNLTLIVIHNIISHKQNQHPENPTQIG